MLATSAYFQRNYVLWDWHFNMQYICIIAIYTSELTFQLLNWTINLCDIVYRKFHMPVLKRTFDLDSLMFSEQEFPRLYQETCREKNIGNKQTNKKTPKLLFCFLKLKISLYRGKFSSAKTLSLYTTAICKVIGASIILLQK